VSFIASQHQYNQHTCVLWPTMEKYVIKRGELIEWIMLFCLFRKPDLYVFTFPIIRLTLVIPRFYHIFYRNPKLNQVLAGRKMLKEMCRNSCVSDFPHNEIRHSSNQERVAFLGVRRKSSIGQFAIWVHLWSIICVYTRESSWNPNSNTVAPDRPRHDTPAPRTTCVIAQQYSSIILVSLFFSSFTEKFSAHLKNNNISPFLLV
jgi:hypothetical protein